MRHPSARTRGSIGLFASLSIALSSCRSEPQATEGPSPDALEPVGAEVVGWEESAVDGVICRHPVVEAHCRNGWCRIQNGCFIMGSPETELGRGANTERLTAVTLTHAFEIGQFEVTRRVWSEDAQQMPQKPEPVIEAPETCLEPACPLRYATWFEALQFANLLSERHDPPLEPCYELSGCEGTLGAGMTCAAVEATAATVYECEGYRLPTEAEWEYAARAGTRTAYYSGDVTYSGDNVTDVLAMSLPEPNLEEVAWYKDNSDNRTHPVGTKRPNRWLLFDMLGNVAEWTSDQPIFRDEPGPVTNPVTELGLTTEYAADMRVTKGGTAAGRRTSARAGGWSYPPSTSTTQGIGFRLARTLE